MPRLVPIDRPDVPPLAITPRLRTQLIYFCRPAGSPGVPALAEGEFYFDPEDVAKTLDDGVVLLISPLDTDNATEVEISEEQEALLNWLQQQGVRHVRLADS